ncbi:MAG: CU044_2847 family protein [Anaerolineae bacterium]
MGIVFSIILNQKFEVAFAGVKKSATILQQQLDELRADEVEETFGLKATGEAGNFAIGQVGVKVNYTVTLKWKNEQDKDNKVATEKSVD